MKKNLLFVPALAGMMFFTACGSEEDVPNTGLGNEVQEISLQVANYGDELQSRAGRPLLSDEAAQNIDNVVLFIVNNGEIVYTETVSDWMTDGVSDKYANGRQKKIVLEGDDKLAPGSYKIYAFGYSNKSGYDLSPITSLKKKDRYTENITINYNAGNDVPEEIFAGSVDVTVGSDKTFTKSVVLNRQVAGGYVYAYNIPMDKNLDLDSRLELVASDANDQLVLGYFANVDLSSNGENSGNDVKYVVNGSKVGTPSTVICSAKLGDWYTEIRDNDGNGIVDDDAWIATADATDRQGGKYQKGSVFAANFIIPFEKIDGQQTLKLQLVKADGSIIRFWNINLPELATRLFVWDGSDWKLNSPANETTHTYSIVRNHLYSVGKKTKDGNPDDPDTPDTPDEPEDLSKSQNINLRVNHNWEVIHKMEVE